MNIEKLLCHKSASFLCSWFSNFGYILIHRTHKNAYFLIKEIWSDSNSCLTHYLLTEKFWLKDLSDFRGQVAGCVFSRSTSFVFLDLNYCNINSFGCLALTSWEFTEIMHSQNQSLTWWFPLLQVKRQAWLKANIQEVSKQVKCYFYIFLKISFTFNSFTCDCFLIFLLFILLAVSQFGFSY